MKILITNFHLRNWAGTELFTLDLARELKNKRHTVFVFSMILGKVAEEISQLEIPVTNNLLDFQDEKFDIIHAQHSLTALATRLVFPLTPMVLMAHGMVPVLEQPFRVDLGISGYITGSEGTKNHLIKNYSITPEKIEVIGNFIDTEKFYLKNALNEKPRKLLFLSNHNREKIRNIIQESCQDLEIEFSHAGLPENPVRNVENYINQADIVVSLGRGALEAMACGRNVVVYDINGGDGWVDENNFYELRKNNFSGNRYKLDYTVDDLKKEILKYNKTTGKNLRELVRKEYSKEVIIGKFEAVYERLKNDTARRIESIIQPGTLGKKDFLSAGRVSGLLLSDNFWELARKFGADNELKKKVDYLVLISKLKLGEEGFSPISFIKIGPRQMLKIMTKIYQEENFWGFVQKISYLLGSAFRK